MICQVEVNSSRHHDLEQSIRSTTVKINFDKSNEMLSSLKADNDTIYMKVSIVDHPNTHRMIVFTSTIINISIINKRNKRKTLIISDIMTIPFQLGSNLENDPGMIYLTTFMLANIFSEKIAR